jgi:hypothetical protein
MNLIFVGILVLIALIVGGAIIAFAGWIGLIVLPVLLVILVVMAIRGGRAAGDEAVRAERRQTSPDPFDDPPPARPGDLSSGGGVQG